MSMDFSLCQMLLSPSFPVLLTFLLFFLILVRHRKSSKAQGKAPPGPKPLPIIGNLHKLSGGLPHHVLTRLCNQYGAVMKLQLGQIVAVVISSPDVAKEVLKTKESSCFAQRPKVYAVEVMSYDNSSIVHAPYSDYWRETRKIAMLELLSSKRVQSFRSIREEEAWDLVEFVSSSEGRTVNLSERLFTLTNNVVCRAGFGKKRKDQNDFIKLLDEAMHLAGGFLIADLYPSLTFLPSLTGMKTALMKIRKKFDKILEEIVAEHKMKREAAVSANAKHEEEDLLDTLLNYGAANKNEFHLTKDQIKGITLEIFSAGFETTATSTEWVISELLKNPRVMEKAQVEVRQACHGKTKIEEADVQKLTYLKSVIKETFRLHPPVALVAREALETCEIGGYIIPAKAKILINTYAMGRDPEIWEDPLSFTPERFEGSAIDFKGNHFELLPFGAGRRICPGISFASSNMELALAQLLYHFDWKLANGIKLEHIDMTEIYKMTARKKENLYVIPTIRIPFKK